MLALQDEEVFFGYLSVADGMIYMKLANKCMYKKHLIKTGWKELISQCKDRNFEH